MLTHSNYEEDPRVRREAEAIVASGRPVDVYALRQPGALGREVIDGVRLRRLPVQRHQGAGLAIYLGEYLAFLGLAGAAVTAAHPRRRYALLQVHTLPDFLAFGGLPLKIAGVPLLLDLHEAMPEFFRSRFAGRFGPLGVRLLGWQERASIAVAGHAVTVNEALRDRLVGLGIRPDKVSVVPNAPSLARFDPARSRHRTFAEDGVVRLVYAGALSPIYELDVAFAALALLGDLRPELDMTLDLYGRDFNEVPLAALARDLGVAGRVRFHDRIAIDRVPAALAEADIGIAPTRRSRFTDFSLSTKLFEYAAMEKPVVASRLPLVERVFGEVVTSYAPGDPRDLARAILRVVDEPLEREVRVARGRTCVAELAWERESERYIALVERLAVDGRARPERTTPGGAP